MFKTSLLGNLVLVDNGEALIKLIFLHSRELPVNIPQTLSPVIKEAVKQLQAYLKGELFEFSIPLCLIGTEFQQQVWQRLLTIPYGDTVSYKEVADLIQRPTASRSIGLASHCNSLPIFVPCHRIVGCQGNLSGYAGGIQIKKDLIFLEAKYKSHRNDIMSCKSSDTKIH